MKPKLYWEREGDAWSARHLRAEGALSLGEGALSLEEGALSLAEGALSLVPLRLHKPPEAVARIATNLQVFLPRGPALNRWHPCAQQ